MPALDTNIFVVRAFLVMPARDAPFFVVTAFLLVMPALDAGIHVFRRGAQQSRECLDRVRA
jgi:hypothetical protein